jgi:hypothetical protein
MMFHIHIEFLYILICSIVEGIKVRDYELNGITYE